jgi:hypothetical protein
MAPKLHQDRNLLLHLPHYICMINRFVIHFIDSLHCPLGALVCTNSAYQHDFTERPLPKGTMLLEFDVEQILEWRDNRIVVHAGGDTAAFYRLLKLLLRDCAIVCDSGERAFVPMLAT